MLVGTTGPFGNVVKIRPPLVFSKSDSDLLFEQLDFALSGADPSQASQVATAVAALISLVVDNTALREAQSASRIERSSTPPIRPP